MRSLLTRFWRDRLGATAIEYGLISALIAVALIAGAQVVGNSINNTMDGAAQHLKDTQ